MKCVECGSDILDEDMYCPKCGNRIERDVISSHDNKSIIRAIVIGAALLTVVLLVVMLFTGKPNGKYYRGHRNSDGTFEYIGNDYFEFKIGGDLEFMQAGSIEHGTYSVKNNIVNITIPSFGRTVMVEWDKGDNELIYHDGGYVEVWKK